MILYFKLTKNNNIAEVVSEVRRSNLPSKTYNTHKVIGLDPLSEFALEMDPLSRAALEIVRNIVKRFFITVP